MGDIRIGLAGLGALGEMHLNNVLEEVSGATIIAVCDIRADRVKEIKEKYNIPYGYTDYDKMLENKELDAVMIITNVGAHHDQCIKAAEAGLNIFCEKPLAKTITECHEIEKAIEENHVKAFSLGFMRRSDPSYAEAKRRVRAGEIGDVIMFKSVSLDPSTVLPGHIANVRKGLYAPFFYLMGNHDADLALWFLNSDIESVYAAGGAYVEKEFAKYNDYDNAMALARFQNGTVAMIQVGRTHNSSHVSAEIIGTKGTIRINNIPNATRLECFYENGYSQPVEPTFLARWKNAYICEIKDWIACINGKKKLEVTVYDGAKSLRICDMIQKAYLEKRVVTIGEMEA